MIFYAILMNVIYCTEYKVLDVGYKNFVDAKIVISIIPPNSSRAKWLIKEAAAGRKLIDCTHGRKTSSLITLSSGHLVLSSLKYHSIVRRLRSSTNSGDMSEKLSINKQLLKAMEEIED